MKRQFIIFALALCALVSCKDNSGLYGLLTDYDYRIAQLEKLCDQMNTNIESLQTIINAQQTGDYITAITPIKENGVEIGYTITFANHEPITIYHGKNGKDGKDGQNGTNGTNGTNGQDGHTPVIGVAQDTDGVYYWTLDGTWLLDGNGQKIRVTGQDGKDGKDGKDGQDGTNGTNGQDGITPQLKIEADYWWISYDNGVTWTQLGKAKGDKGDKGEDGASGGSIFTYILKQGGYVYFYLTDGTVIKMQIVEGTADNFVISISLNKTKDTLGIGETDQLVATTTPYATTPVSWTSDNTSIVTIDNNGVITAINTGNAIITAKAVDKTAKCTVTVYLKNPYFSVSATKKIQFAPGNLQYQRSTGTCRFASSQYTRSSLATNKNNAADSWVDAILFSVNIDGVNLTNSEYNEISGTQYDWGHFAITNGRNTPDLWRTLTSSEWAYLLSSRNKANQLKTAATVNGVKGYILLPDNWLTPVQVSLTISNDYADNVISSANWSIFELSGATFLPCTYNGYFSSGTYYEEGFSYWTSTTKSSDKRYGIVISKDNSGLIIDNNGIDKRQYLAVRLVKDVE